MRPRKTFAVRAHSPLHPTELLDLKRRVAKGEPLSMRQRRYLGWLFRQLEPNTAHLLSALRKGTALAIAVQARKEARKLESYSAIYMHLAKEFPKEARVSAATVRQAWEDHGRNTLDWFKRNAGDIEAANSLRVGACHDLAKHFGADEARLLAATSPP